MQNNILSICTWRQIRNFESQTCRLTPPVEESEKKQKQGVGRLKKRKAAYLLGKCLDNTFFE